MLGDDLFLCGITYEELLEWPEMADVKEELENILYSNLRHGAMTTYKSGCTGPLCRMAEKERGRRRNRRKALREGRDYYEGRSGRLYDRDDLLLALADYQEVAMTVKRLEAKRAS